MKEELAVLLRDVALELQKRGNEDATNLLDRIDEILLPAFGIPEPITLDRKFKRSGPITFEVVKYGKAPEEVTVARYIPEFIDKLIEQLKSDHERWGNTWLNRPKEGQELRTKARYMDYFDQFEHAKLGTPVPWMKIVGRALICWIREQHPELCIDVNEVIEEDMKKMGFERPPKTAAEAHKALREINYAKAAPPPTTPYPGKKSEDGVGVEDEGNHTSTPWVGCQTCRDEGLVDKPEEEIIGVKVSEKGVEDIHEDKEKPVEESSAGIMAPFTYSGDPEEKPVEDMTTKELVESGPTLLEFQHRPDCVVELNPALPPSECDCQGDCNPSTPTVYLARPAPTNSPIAHVRNEKIENIGQGTLAYSPKNDKDGKLILSSIKFTNGTGQDAPELGRCNEDGLILPHSRVVGVMSRVSSNGQYRITEARRIGSQDTIYVSYDYEFSMPQE